MKGIFLQILYAFKRDYVFVGITFITFLVSLFGIFIGSNAVVEANEAKIVYTAGLSRITIIIGFIIFITFSIKRMFDNHEIEFILSHSISRNKILISMFCGYSIILVSLIFPIMLLLILLQAKIINILFWTFSVYMEGLLVLSFSLCASLILKSFFQALTGSLFLYLIGRTIGNFVAYITLSAEFSFQTILANILKVLSIFIPRLDIFGKTSWLIYSNYSMSSFLLFTVQCVIFCSIFLLIAIIDLKNKEF